MLAESNVPTIPAVVLTMNFMVCVFDSLTSVGLCLLCILENIFNLFPLCILMRRDEVNRCVCDGDGDDCSLDSEDDGADEFFVVHGMDVGWMDGEERGAGPSGPHCASLEITSDGCATRSIRGTRNA